MCIECCVVSVQCKTMIILKLTGASEVIVNSLELPMCVFLFVWHLPKKRWDSQSQYSKTYSKIGIWPVKLLYFMPLASLREWIVCDIFSMRWFRTHLSCRANQCSTYSHIHSVCLCSNDFILSTQAKCRRS